MSETFAEKLKAWRLARGLTQPEAGRVLKVGKSWISQVENGREPGELLVRKLQLAESTGTYKVHSVAGNERGGALHARLIKVASWAQAGAVTDYDEIPEDWRVEVATDCPDIDAVGVEIRGDSMLPAYQERDVVVMMPSRAPRTGCLVVAKLRAEGVCFKLYAEPTRGIIRLSSYNEAYSPIERQRDDFDWIFPIYEAKRYLWFL